MLIIIFSKSLSSFISPMVGTLTGTTILGESGPGGNGNDVILCILQNSKIGASPSDSG